MAAGILTDAQVRKLRSKASRYDRATGVTNLKIRIEPCGRKSWISLFGFAMDRQTKKIGDALAIPVKEAAELHEQNRILWERGESIHREKTQVLTIERMLDQYWTKAPHRGVKTLSERRRMIDKDVLPVLGEREAENVTRGELIALLEGIRDRGAPVVANRVKEILSATWRWAYRHELVQTNPAADLPDMARGLPREVVVKPAELAKLWPRFTGQPMNGFRRTMSLEVGTALLLVVFTACRSAEASGARWGEFDLTEGWWTIPAERFKDGRNHWVYLHPEIRRRLQALRPDNAGAQDLVFRSPRTEGPLGEKSLHQALTRTTQGEFHVRDVRRSVATAMGDAGVFPFVIERVLGHAQPRLQRIYNRAELDSPSKEAWIQWGDRLLDEVRKQGGLVDE